MPARWSFDHSRRLVEIVLEGDTGEAEALRFFDELEAANAQPYRKLIDAREATPRIDERLLKLVTTRISGYRNPGPIAAVVDGAYFDGLAKLFLLAVDAERRARVFRTVDEARDWLDAIARETISQ